MALFYMNFWKTKTSPLFIYTIHFGTKSGTLSISLKNFILSILFHPSGLPFKSRSYHPELLAVPPSWVPSATLISKLSTWFRQTCVMVKFQQTTALHRLLLKWDCIPLHILFNERKINRPFHLWMSYFIPTRWYMKFLSFLYPCISPER
jgi:hypothetical protein